MNDKNFDLKSAQKQYESELNEFLQTHQELQSIYQTISGIPLKPVYTPSDLEGIDYLKDVGFPGQYPYTRGLYHNGY